MFIVQMTAAVGVTAFVIFTITTIALVISASEKTEEKEGKRRFVKRPWHAVKIPTGNTVFVTVGSKLHGIWPNVGGHHISSEEDPEGRHWLVKTREKPDPERNHSDYQHREKHAKRRIEESLFHGSFFAGRFWRARSLPWVLIGGWYYLFLWRWFGIRTTLVLLLYPNNQIHPFDIKSRLRLLEGHRVSERAPLRERVVESGGDTEVHSLLFTVPRPILVEGVELGGDNARVNILILAFFQQVIPALPVFYLKGDFFTLLDTAVEAGLTNFGANHRVAIDANGNLVDHTYDKSRRKKKEEEAKGLQQENRESKKHFEARKQAILDSYQPAPLTLRYWLQMDRIAAIEGYLRGINASPSYYKQLKELSGEDGELFHHLHFNLLEGHAPSLGPADTVDDVEKNRWDEKIGQGIIPRIGFALVSFRLQAWESHTDSSELDAAIRGVEVNSRQAQAARKKAEGDRDVAILLAEGRAALYERPVSKLTALGVNPNTAARVLETDQRTANIGGGSSSVTTYIEGGSTSSTESGSTPQPSIMIPATQPPPQPPPSPAPPATGGGAGT